MINRCKNRKFFDETAFLWFNLDFLSKKGIFNPIFLFNVMKKSIFAPKIKQHTLYEKDFFNHYVLDGHPVRFGADHREDLLFQTT